MNSDLVKFNKALALWHTLLNKYSVKIFHIGKAYKFINGCVVTNIPLEIRICLAPLLGSHTKHSHIQHVSFISINNTRLRLDNFQWNEIMLTSLRSPMALVRSIHVFTERTKLLLPAAFLIVPNSVQLKSGLYSISHSPRYSIVLLRLNQRKIICSCI